MVNDLHIASNIEPILLTSQRDNRQSQVNFGKVVKVTPGKRHVWVESNVGLVRKSVDSFEGEIQ